MNSKQHKLIVVLVIPALAFGEFMLDLYTPLGISDWVWYFIPVSLTIFAGGRFLPYLLAGIFSGLIVAGFYFSPPGIDPKLALASRGIGICVLWLVAALISQHKHEEEALRQSKKNLQRAQAVMRIGTWHLDIRHNVLTWSAETCRMFGIRPGQALTHESFIACVHPADREDVVRAWDAALRGAPYDIEHRIVVGSETRWVRERAEIGFDAQSNAREAIGTVQDITEHKNAEAQIREQASLLDLAPDAILVRDLEDRILYWNRSAERIYGWTASEAIGRKLMQLLHKDGFDASKYEEAGKAVREKGDWQGEFTTRTKSGREVIVEARWTLVRDSQGNPKSVLVISTDVTGKKKLEAQFLRSQRMEGLGTLAGGIAHDLNNVLTPLLVSVQVLKEKITDADGQSLLDTLEANVRRGASLVKQVLIFGRGVEGERVMVHPQHVAREIKQIIHETFPKSVEFKFHFAADLWTVIGDPTQLHQVLLNLCVNARDAMPNGGKLSLHMENVTFDETYAGMNPEARPGPYVAISVADTGTGIPEEIQDKIFDPFFSTKAPGKGTGLGLFTTLGIVRNHGGFVHCHSEPGQGTTFKVYFPANVAAVAVERAAVEESKLPRGHNELVLVVDDEEPIRNLVQKALEHFGYRVLLAVDGTEAVSIYASRQKEIAVVITDMIMPNMEGPAAIVALRAINPEVKIIASSGAASDRSMARVRDTGIRHYIAKPYTAEVMLNTLHEVLHGSPAK